VLGDSGRQRTVFCRQGFVELLGEGDEEGIANFEVVPQPPGAIAQPERGNDR
jgi:hypothetical protein